MKAIYQCDYCGATYNDEATCHACEEFHVHPLRLESGFFKKFPDWRQPYPAHLLVRMKNGRLARYEYSGVIQEKVHEDDMKNEEQKQ